MTRVYRHFPSKDDLVLAQLDQWTAFSGLTELLAEIPDELSPADAGVGTCSESSSE